MITTILDHMLVRTVVIPVIATAYAATIPPKEKPFPQHDDRFLMSVRGPVVGGRAGFARIYASPAGRDGWTTTVTCGTVDARGREKILLQAPGTAYRDRTSFTGTWSPLGGAYGEAQMRTWAVDRQEGLDVVVSMSGPCPDRGTGDVSTGD